MRIRTLILAASSVVSLLFFGGSYFAINKIFENTTRENAAQASTVIARTIFNAMFEAMNAGWGRAEVNSFLDRTHQAMQGTPVLVDVYPSQPVSEKSGLIEMPQLDQVLRQAMEDGQVRHLEAGEDGMRVRHLFPLKAEARCLRCHTNAHVGTVLGVMDVSQDMGPMMDKARSELRWAMAAVVLLAMFGAALAVSWVERRLEGALEAIACGVDRVNAVGDLRHLRFDRQLLGIEEFDRLFEHMGELLERVRGVAVDKDVLKFEIGLLEKFIITSEVVKDWRAYVVQLLIDVNRVVGTGVLFSIFKTDDKLFEIEIFWYRQAADETRALLERHVRDALAEQALFNHPTEMVTHHHVAEPNNEMMLSEEQMRLHVKALFVDKPKIGGIVGIGMQSDVFEDEALHLVTDSVLSTLLNVVGSVKAIHKYTKDLEYYAMRDPLTGLFNQRVFWELLGYEVSRAQRHSYSFALLLLDLDNFKVINDSHGHAIGDRYLQTFAVAVKGVLRLGDILARYGGDEFVLILPDADLEQACNVAERVLQAAETITVDVGDGTLAHGTVSIGIAIYPDHANEAKDLFLFADNMMYKAKGEGKHRVGIPTEHDLLDVFRDLTQKTTVILNAIDERRVTPYFQPILDIEAGEIVAYEVLSRIVVNGKPMAASDFIEIVEEVGAIHRHDCLVIDRALEYLVGSNYQGQLFINLSPQAMVKSEFGNAIRRIVANAGVAPQRLVFEITERDTAKNFSQLERFLNEMKADGFGLAIDDFGSGFSSFRYLRHFPVDHLKIEGDFIVNMLDNQQDQAFVRSMHGLSRNLGIRTIAEFVENQAVLDGLRQIGIDLAQGYFVGRPAKDIPPNSHWRAPQEPSA